MPQNLTSFGICISSPLGLSAERKSIKQTVESYNDEDGYERAIHFKTFYGEELPNQNDTAGEHTKDNILRCDYFILVLHDKWGALAQSDGRISSATEEQFNLALSTLKDAKTALKEIVIFFKDVLPSQLADAGPELQQIIAFRNDRQTKEDFLCHKFASLAELTAILNTFLARWAREPEQSKKGKGISSKHNKIERINTKFSQTEATALNFRLGSDNLDLVVLRAEEYFRNGEVEQADLLYNLVYSISSNPKHFLEYGKYLRKQYRLYLAEEVLKKSIEMAESSLDEECRANALRQLGRVYEFRGELDNSIIEFQKAYNIFKAIGDDLGRARTLMDLGFALCKKNNSQKATENLLQAIEIYEDANDKFGLGSAYCYLGVIHKDSGNFEKAEHCYDCALDYLKLSEKSNESEVAIVKSNLGVLKRMKYSLDEALILHNEALRFFEKSTDIRARAREYSNIGVVYRLTGKYKEAMSSHQQALQLEEKALNTKGKGVQLANIGLNLMELHDLTRAKIYFDEALDINEKLSDEKSMAIQYRNLAKLEMERSEYIKAEINIKRSIELEIKCNNKVGVAESKELYGDILIRWRKANLKAIELYSVALDIYEQYNQKRNCERLELKISQSR